MHFNPLYALAVLAVSVAAAPAPQHFSKMLDPELAVLDDIQPSPSIDNFDKHKIKRQEEQEEEKSGWVDRTPHNVPASKKIILCIWPWNTQC